MDKNKIAGISPAQSVTSSIILSMLVGLIFSPTISNAISVFIPISMFICTIGGGLVFFGILCSGAQEIPTKHGGVLTVLGKRHRVIFSEGWHPLIPFMTELISVDLRERVLHIPDTKATDDQNFFLVPTGSSDPDKSGDEQVVMNVRAVLKFEVKDPFGFLNKSESAIIDALQNKVPDLVRSMASAMNDQQLLKEKNAVAGGVKTSIDKLYDCITVNGLDLPKVIWADTEMSRAKQSRALQHAQNQGQFDDLLGDHGTAERVKQVAAKFREAGMSEEEAARKAFEAVQTQENRLTVVRQEYQFAGGSNALTEAAAILANKGGK